MKRPATIFAAGISILFVQYTGHCDTHLSQKTYSNHTGTKLKPLSIKTVIDCEIPADHWQDPDTSIESAPRTDTAVAKQEPEDDMFVPFFDFTTLYEDEENFQLMNELFAPPPERITNKTDAYMEIAEHLNMSFVKKGYRRVKNYEEDLSSQVEHKMAEFTRFDIKLKPDLFKLKIFSSIKINEFQRIDISAGRGGQSAVYKIEVPMHKLKRFITSANTHFISLPVNAIGATERFFP